MDSLESDILKKNKLQTTTTAAAAIVITQKKTRKDRQKQKGGRLGEGEEKEEEGEKERKRGRRGEGEERRRGRQEGEGEGECPLPADTSILSRPTLGLELIGRLVARSIDSWHDRLPLRTMVRPLEPGISPELFRTQMSSPLVNYPFYLFIAAPTHTCI